MSVPIVTADRETLLALTVRLPNGCLLWKRKTDAKGRGKIWIDGKLRLAHRAMWEATNGPIPPGGMICHHCDFGGCLEVAHMYVGDQQTNMCDMRERRRSFGATQPEACRAAGRKGGMANTWAKGTGNPKVKLSPEAVERIRVDPRPTRFLAAQHGVCRTTIQRIRSGQLWQR